MDNKNELNSPVIKPPKSKLPPEVNPVPDHLLQRLKEFGYGIANTTEGLSVVTKSTKLEISSQPDQKPPKQIILDDTVSSLYLQNDLSQAVEEQLSLEEFAKNKQVSKIFSLVFQYLNQIEEVYYHYIVTNLQSKISQYQQERQPEKAKALEELQEILRNDEKLYDYIAKVRKNLDLIDEEKLPKELRELHQQVFSSISSCSDETVEEITIVVAKLISSSKEFTFPRTKKMLEILDFIIGYKGKSKKQLLLPNSSAIASILTDALRNQPLLRESPENWKMILSIADWLDFSPSDADEFMSYYLEKGLSMKNPIVTRLAFIAENKLPQGRFAKEQEKRRNLFAQSHKEAEEKGLLDLFLHPPDESFSRELEYDTDRVLSGSLSFENFINQYLPTIDEEKKQRLISQYEWNKNKETLVDFFLKIKNVYYQGQKLIEQIAFALPPSELKGKIGYEVEYRVFSNISPNAPLFNLPPEFCFSFPSSREISNGFAIEVKPNYRFLEGVSPFEAAIKLALWQRRNQGVVYPQSFHIHLDKQDFSSFSDFYKDRSFLSAEIRHNDIGTWEIRQLSATPENLSAFLNSILIGKMSQFLLLENWQKSLFSQLSQIPTDLVSFNQKLESKILIDSRLIKLTEAIKEDPSEFSYVIESAFSSPHERVVDYILNNTKLAGVIIKAIKKDLLKFRYVIEKAFSSPHERVGIYLIEQLTEAIKENPSKFHYVIASAFSSPHERVVDYILNNTKLAGVIIKAIKEDLLKFSNFIETKIEKLRPFLKELNCFFFLHEPANRKVFSSLFF